MTSLARPDVTAAETMRAVGSRVREVRKTRRLTLKDVAEHTGVSTSMLSMLERGVTTASVGTLVSVASALGVHMSDLFNHPRDDMQSPVRRLADQPTVRSNSGTTRRIAHHDQRTGIEFAVNEYPPGSASGSGATHHGGREFGVVISGNLTIELDGELHDLSPGDAIAYSSTRPHRIANQGDTPTMTVWVNVDAH